MKIKCKICNDVFKSLMGLSNHVRVYGLTAKNYYDKYLKKKDEGLCLNCNKQTKYAGMVIGYNKFCSIKCGSQKEFNGMYNKTHTKEVRKILSIASTKEKVKNKCKRCNDVFQVVPSQKHKMHHCKKCSKIVKKHKGINNPMFGRSQSKEARKKMKKASKKRWLRPFSEETRQKQSISQINRLIRDGESPRDKRFNTGKFYSKKNKKEIYHASSYELAAFKLLEQMSHVKLYQRCDFYIDYKFKKKSCRYLPDIFVEYGCSQNEIIEIKPKKQMKEPRNKAKFKAAEKHAEEHGLKFTIWNEKELQIKKV